MLHLNCHLLNNWRCCTGLSYLQTLVPAVAVETSEEKEGVVVVSVWLVELYYYYLRTFLSLKEGSSHILNFIQEVILVVWIWKFSFNFTAQCCQFKINWVVLFACKVYDFISQFFSLYLSSWLAFLNNADVLLDSGLKLSNIIVTLCSKLLDYILLKSGNISGLYFT